VDHSGIGDRRPTMTRGATAFVGMDLFAERCAMH
jgi:hypothetical protein